MTVVIFRHGAISFHTYVLTLLKKWSRKNTILKKLIRTFKIIKKINKIQNFLVKLSFILIYKKKVIYTEKKTNT